MFYFGLDENGLINSHIFDRKISNLKPSMIAPKLYPWMSSLPSWHSDKKQGLAPIPQTHVPSLAELLLSELDLDCERSADSCSH